MPTSMLPVHWVHLPDEVINLLTRIPGVYVNLRPDQWINPPTWIADDGFFVFPTVRNFLKTVDSTIRVAILFQGYGAEVGVAVVDLPKITCCAEFGYPALNIEQPKAMKKIHGNHFWGGFILAIAKVHQTTEIFAKRDQNFQNFIQLAKTSVIP